MSICLAVATGAYSAIGARCAVAVLRTELHMIRSFRWKMGMDSCLKLSEKRCNSDLLMWLFGAPVILPSLFFAPVVFVSPFRTCKAPHATRTARAELLAWSPSHDQIRVSSICFRTMVYFPLLVFNNKSIITGHMLDFCQWA